MDKCKTCERRNKVNPKHCQVMKKQFAKCWAYTNDPEWADKFKRASKVYARSHV